MKPNYDISNHFNLSLGLSNKNDMDFIGDTTGLGYQINHSGFIKGSTYFNPFNNNETSLCFQEDIDIIF